MQPSPLAALFDPLLNQLEAGVLLLDEALQIRFWNQWLVQHSNLAPQDVLGKTLGEALGINAGAYLLQRARQVIEKGLSSILSNTIHRHPLPLYSAPHSKVPIEQKLILSQLKAEGRRYCLIHVYDVSDLLRRERSLKRQAKTLRDTVAELTEAEQQLRSFYELSPDGIMILDADGRLRQTNSAAQRMFELYDQPALYCFQQLVVGLDEEVSLERQFFSGRAGNTVENIHLSGQSLGGKAFPLEVSLLKTGSDEKRSFYVVCRDITERQQTERRLKKLAHYDTLTGLANRATFNDELQNAVRNAARHGHELALIYIDLDNLKPVNDNLGHRYGDQLLREVARRLQSSVREHDLVARLGGDEFVILLSDAREGQLPDLTQISQRLLAQIRQPLRLDGKTLQPSASIGIAVNSSTDPDELVRHADVAMYAAKKQGKDICVFYQVDLDNRPDLNPLG